GGVTAGGLVGHNHDNGTIVDSSATGAVVGTGISVFNSNCSFNANCLSVNAGGLVGLNGGTITGSDSNLLTFATGDVSVTGGGVAGGLVGFNSGAITFAFAAGNVTGAAGAA